MRSALQAYVPTLPACSAMLDLDLAMLFIVPALAPKAIRATPGSVAVLRLPPRQAIHMHAGKCAPPVTEDVILDAAFAPLNP